MDTPKENFSDWYNLIMKEAQLCDLRYNLKGFTVIQPNAADVMGRMYRIYEDALEARGHRKAYFPSLIHEKNLETEKEHVEGFAPEVFWVTEAGKNKLEERMLMRPTSETAIYPMYALWINGKSDLPLKIYQSCQVWRYETKATKPFIRTREFHWIEAHDVFATEEEALAQIDEDMQMAQDIIHGSFGIPFIFFKRPQWDKFAGAVDTFAADTLLPDGKTLQLPSTHNLGTNFAKSFGIKYMDDDGQEKYAHQTTYGPCISRIFAALISVHGDNKGLILPFHLANVQVAIVPILKKDNGEKVLEFARNLEKTLSKSFRTTLDDSENTPGFKYNYWELNGCPVRIEVGERDIDSGKAMVARRDTGEKSQVPFEELPAHIEGLRKEINAALIKRADSGFASLQKSADTLEGLKSELDSGGGFVRVPFCSDTMDAEACAEKAKDYCSANMRGSKHEGEGKPEGKKCIGCGKEATIYLYAARQY